MRSLLLRTLSYLIIHILIIKTHQLRSTVYLPCNNKKELHIKTLKIIFDMLPNCHSPRLSVCTVSRINMTCAYIHICAWIKLCAHISRYLILFYCRNSNFYVLTHIYTHVSVCVLVYVRFSGFCTHKNCMTQFSTLQFKFTDSHKFYSCQIICWPTLLNINRCCSDASVTWP